MNFASWPFLALFLPAAIAVFWSIRGQDCARARQAWLTAVSLLFYAVSGMTNLMVLLGSITLNYIAGSLLANGLESRRARKAVLWVAVLFNVGLLLLFKILALEERPAHGFLAAPEILIPLALSFITFQQIGFIVACYRRQVRSLSAFNYLFFVAFFPQLVMGPILQWHHLERQVSAGALSRTSALNLAVGFSIFIVGLAKKVLLADPLGGMVTGVYAAAEAGGSVTPAEAWAAAIAFQFQLFLDFSGYADMAIGLARMVNINLPINFDQPFKAATRFDLWRRWHITFVIFMRNNVFMPLVRHARLPAWAALAVTGMLSGLWHGLGWTFLLWGLVQTVLLLCEHRWLPTTTPTGRFILPVAVGFTFLITVLVGALFRSPTLEVAQTIFSALGSAIWTDPAQLAAPGIQFPLITWIDAAHFLAAAVVIWILPDTIRFFERYWTAIDPRPGAMSKAAEARGAARIRFELTPAWGAVMAALLVAALLGLGDSNRFVYVQF